MRPFIIADNQYISFEGIVSLVRETAGTDDIYRATNRKELLDLLRKYPSAAVVLDYTLFDFSGANELLIVKEGFPEVSWLLFSEELKEQFVRFILYSSQEYGFNIVLKSGTRDEIVTALRCTGNKETYLCSHIGNMLKNGPVQSSTEDKLTPTEKQILREIANGKTTKEIAFDKNLSFHTINSHRKNIFRKLDVNNVHEAIKYAVRAGIADLTEYYI